MFNNDGTKVLEATGALNFSVTGFASAIATNVTVKWNTSAIDYSANGASLALSIGGITGATINVAPNTQSVAITGLSVDISSFVHLSGDFAFQKNASGIQAVASGVAATFGPGPPTHGVSNGSLSLLFNNDGTKVLEATGALNFSVTGFASATATNVTVKLNTSAVDYSANGSSVALSIGGIIGASPTRRSSDLSVAITGLSVDISSFVHLSGDFAFQKNASGIQAVATGVTATLSAGPATLGVTNGSLSLLFTND